LGSANGTYVNGCRISGATNARIGDVIGLGSLQLEVTASGLRRRREATGGVVVEVEHLVVDVPGRRLLDDVSLTILPAEFVGLMGPSGAGKTTLMSAMNGYSQPTAGQVLINGSDLYEYYGEFSTVLGYVPQDDIMHRELTVGQALYYTARLRMPSGVTDAEIQTRIADVLQQLGLDGTANTLIGSPERKGISGGQRKRVNLAMELLTDPVVLFLDEPTSGLSSEDSLRVMKLLRQLADSGKSILLTIHQPSLEAYRLMDNLVVVSKDRQGTGPGNLVYYGPAYPDAVAFFNPQGQTPAATKELSPEDIFSGLEKSPTDTWRNRFEKSRYHREFVAGRVGQRAPAGASRKTASERGSFADQCITLVRRSCRIKLADRWNTAILLIQAPIVALILILVFGEHARQTLTVDSWAQTTNASAMTVFLTALSALWFGCSNAVREIVGEWAVYRRERMVNLNLAAYVLSKLIVGAFFCMIQCAILVVGTRWGCGLHGPLFSSFLVTMLVACTGLALGLLLSAVARTTEVALGMLPLVLIPMVVLGGGLLPVHTMQAPLQSLAYCLPLRSGFESLLLIESSRWTLGPSAFSEGLAPQRTSDDSDRPDLAEAFFPKDQRAGVSTSVLLLAGMFLTLVAGIWLVIRARDLH
jgi:ABC-type multidrug transport system ATPase subunit